MVATRVTLTEVKIFLMVLESADALPTKFTGTSFIPAVVTVIIASPNPTPRDVFHLTYAELYEAISNGRDMRELAAERKELFNHYQKLTPPRILTSEGEYLLGSRGNRDIPARALPGEPVSAGSVEGIAKIILDPNNAEVREGEILIAPFTDPGWTPLFVNSSAVVTEMGGKLTHGAVVAREYGIPPLSVSWMSPKESRMVNA